MTHEKICLFFLLTLILLPQAHSEELTWQDLIKKPELLPSQCTIKETVTFNDGVTIKAGQKLDVIEVNPQEVIVGLPGAAKNFILSPEETDIVITANTSYAKLSPKQKAVTYEQILKTKELWSRELVIKDNLNFGSQRIKTGDKAILIDANKGKLVLAPVNMAFQFELDPEKTDILQQARNFVETTQGTAPGILAQELSGNLVDAKTGQPYLLNPEQGPKYYVLFHGAR